MRILNLIWALLLMTHVTVAAKVIKVACVGNNYVWSKYPQSGTKQLPGAASGLFGRRV